MNINSNFMYIFVGLFVWYIDASIKYLVYQLNESNQASHLKDV